MANSTDSAAIAARLRELDTVHEGAQYLDAQNLDKDGLLAVAAEVWELRGGDRRLSKQALQQKLLDMTIGARRKFQGLREGWQR